MSLDLVGPLREAAQLAAVSAFSSTTYPTERKRAVMIRRCFDVLALVPLICKHRIGRRIVYTYLSK